MAETYLEYVINGQKIFPTQFRKYARQRLTPQKRHHRDFENVGYVLLALPAGSFSSLLTMLLKASGVNMSGRRLLLVATTKSQVTPLNGRGLDNLAETHVSAALT